MPDIEVNEKPIAYKQSKLMYSSFLCNVRRLRKIKKMSQEEIASKCGISSQAYSNIETGQSIPSFFTVCLISCVLGIDLTTLTTNFLH